MKVSVRYWGQTKQAAGRASESVDFEESPTVRELVEVLAEKHGEPLRSHLLDGDGNPRQSLLLVVGEDQVSRDSPRRLADGDVVTLLPPIAGGAGEGRPRGREPSGRPVRNLARRGGHG